MSKQSLTLRDLIASVIQSGATSSLVNLSQTTATDLIRAVIDDTGAEPSLNVSIDGGSPTFDNLYITGDLHVTGNTYQTDQYIADEIYIGPKGQVNSWRFILSNQDLLLQHFDGLNWLTKGTWAPTFYV